MNSHYDVAIIGSGPAGSMAAIQCAQAGLSTILFEKETLPRRKVCAGGLIKKRQPPFCRLICSFRCNSPAPSTRHAYSIPILP